MAAPLSRSLSSRLFAHAYSQFYRSSKYRQGNRKLLDIQAKFHSSDSRKLLLGNKSKLWSLAVLGGGVAVSAFMTGQIMKGEAFKVFAANPQERPVFKPSRQVRIDTDTSGLKLTLYQFQTCPFCCKVRAALDYHGFSYDVIEVNSVTKKQIKWSEYTKVPILVVEVGGQEVIMKDSTVIVSVLESYLCDRTTSLAKYVSYYPSLMETVNGKEKLGFANKYFVMFQETAQLPTTVDQRKEERRWRQWTDDHLVHTLSPNVYRTVKESLQAFNYFSEAGQWEQNFSFLERQMVIYVGAAVMYVLGMVLKSRYNLKDDVRQSLYDACNEWLTAVGNDRPFMGGNQPNLADLAVYGVLNSIEGCNAFQDALNNTKIGQWYSRTKIAVQNHHGALPHNTKSLPSDKPKLKSG